MILGNPDKFIAWDRVEEVGENPKWVSKIGTIIQMGFGDYPQFFGYVKGKKAIKDKFTTTLEATKKKIETEFFRDNEVVFEYETLCDVSLAARV